MQELPSLQELRIGHLLSGLLRTRQRSLQQEESRQCPESPHPGPSGDAQILRWHRTGLPPPPGTQQIYHGRLGSQSHQAIGFSLRRTIHVSGSRRYYGN